MSSREFIKIWKHTYIILLLANPICAFLYIKYISPTHESQFYLRYLAEFYIYKLPWHAIVIVANIISWKMYLNGSNIGLNTEKLLSAGRMAMDVCGASLVFAFINLESPLNYVIWIPAIAYILHNEYTIAYIMICLFLLVGEIFYYRKL